MSGDAVVEGTAVETTGVEPTPEIEPDIAAEDAGVAIVLAISVPLAACAAASGARKSDHSIVSDERLCRWGFRGSQCRLLWVCAAACEDEVSFELTSTESEPRQGPLTSCPIGPVVP